MTKQKDTKERIDSILLKAGVERNEIEATREQILAKVREVMEAELATIRLVFSRSSDTWIAVERELFNKAKEQIAEAILKELRHD